MIAKIEPFEVMEILARAKELERAGEDVIHLEIGEPDFDIPKKAKLESIKAIKEGFTHYTESKGMPELREAIAEYLSSNLDLHISSDKVLITGGVSLGLLYSLSTILDKGDNVIVPDPSYPCYPNIIRFVGGRVKTVGLEEDFSLNIEKLKENIDGKTKAIILNTPSNPTGTYLSSRELKGITEIAEDSDIYVISDEIYSGLVYDRKRSPSILEQNYEKVIMLDGFSKLYAMTGMRIGYAVSTTEIIEDMDKIQQNLYICPSSISQRAALASLECERDVEYMKRKFNERRKLVYRKLKKINGVKVIEPKGAYYIFPDIRKICTDSNKFAEKLLEKEKVAVTPGKAFGKNGEGHIRISYSTSIEKLEDGLNRIENFISQLSSQTVL